MASLRADAQMAEKTLLGRQKPAISGHFSIAGERPLILKAVVQKSCGNWQAPTRCGQRMFSGTEGNAMICVA
jgi:hypothetical protein